MPKVTPSLEVTLTPGWEIPVTSFRPGPLFCLSHGLQILLSVSPSPSSGSPYFSKVSLSAWTSQMVDQFTHLAPTHIFPIPSVFYSCARQIPRVLDSWAAVRSFWKCFTRLWLPMWQAQVQDVSRALLLYQSSLVEVLTCGSGSHYLCVPQIFLPTSLISLMI